MIDLTAGIQTFASRFYDPKVAGDAAGHQALQGAMADVCRLALQCRLAPEGSTDAHNFWRAWSHTDVRLFCDKPPPLDPQLYEGLFRELPRHASETVPLQDQGIEITLRATHRGRSCLANESLRLGCIIAVTEQLDTDRSKTTELRVHRSFTPLHGQGIPAEELDIGLSIYLADYTWRRDVKLEGNNYWDVDRQHIRLNRLALSWKELEQEDPQDCVARYQGDGAVSPQWQTARQKTEEFLPVLLGPLEPYWALFEGIGPV